MHYIAQKQTFFFKLPELDLDPDLVVNFPDPDPDPAKRSGSDRIRIRIRNTASTHISTLAPIFLPLCSAVRAVYGGRGNVGFKTPSFVKEQGPIFRSENYIYLPSPL
jgi:hypothetical protein